MIYWDLEAETKRSTRASQNTSPNASKSASAVAARNISTRATANTTTKEGKPVYSSDKRKKELNTKGSCFDPEGPKRYG